MCSRKASRLAFRAGLSRLLRWAYFSSRSAISPLHKQLTRSGTQGCHPRASPVHSLVTVKARVVLRDLLAQGAENPQLVILHRLLPAAYRAAIRRNPPLPRAALGNQVVGVGRVHQDLPVFVAATPLPRPVQAVTRQSEQVVCHGDLVCAVVIVGVRVLGHCPSLTRAST